jgi:hypothetical protein
MPGNGITAPKFSKIGKGRSRQTPPWHDTDAASSRPFHGVPRQFAWNVRGGVGSMLTPEFGAPHTIVSEPIVAPR